MSAATLIAPPRADAPTSRSFVKKISALAIGSALLFFIVGIASVYKGHAASTVTFAITCAHLSVSLPKLLTQEITLQDPRRLCSRGSARHGYCTLSRESCHRRC